MAPERFEVCSYFRSPFFLTLHVPHSACSQTGAICLDILKSEWSPALTLRTGVLNAVWPASRLTALALPALLSLQALLSCPNPGSYKLLHEPSPSSHLFAQTILRTRRWPGSISGTKRSGRPLVCSQRRPRLGSFSCPRGHSCSVPSPPVD